LKSLPTNCEDIGQSERKTGRWWIVMSLFTAFALSYIDRQMAFSMFPVLKSDLRFSDTQLGLVGSLFVWSYALSMPVAGRIADLVRRDRLVIASLVLWSTATLGTAFSQSALSFLLWRLVMGVTESLYFPAALGIIAVFHSGSSRSRAIGIHQSAQIIGIIAGGWYGGWAVEHVGWRAGFGILWIIGSLYALVLSKVFKGRPVTGKVAQESRPGRAGEFFLQPLYLLLSLAFFGLCAILWIMYAWLPNALYDNFGLSLSSSGLNATLYIQISCGIGILSGGWLADHLISRIPAIRFYCVGCGICCSAPSAYLVFSAVTLAQFRLWGILFGFLAGIAMANIFPAAYDVTSNQTYGFVAGVLNMIGGISGGAAMLLVGIYKETLGTLELMGFTATLAALSGLLLLIGAQVYFPRYRPSN
jgi:MFS transporter, Spinster family, sphingosine-1-phosphate transporter